MNKPSAKPSHFVKRAQRGSMWDENLNIVLTKKTFDYNLNSIYQRMILLHFSQVCNKSCVIVTARSHQKQKTNLRCDFVSHFSVAVDLHLDVKILKQGRTRSLFWANKVTWCPSKCKNEVCECKIVGGGLFGSGSDVSIKLKKSDTYRIIQKQVLMARGEQRRRYSTNTTDTHA